MCQYFLLLVPEDVRGWKEGEHVEGLEGDEGGLAEIIH